MLKKILCLSLCLGLLLGIALPVSADEDTATVSISTTEEFVAFANNCRLDSYSQGLTVTLESDIDLNGVVFVPIPIFSGYFNGKGHTISGLSIKTDGSDQGLFRYLTATAVVENLTVSGNVTPGGSRSNVGAIAGENEGQILRCSFSGTVSGGNYVGGLVGVNAVTGIIEDCKVSGEIYGNHFVGGIAGENYGVIRTCASQARINTTPQQNSVEITDVTMDTLTNAEAVNTVTDLGGIAGINYGVIRSCVNRGDVGYPHMGYNIGGIAGTQSGYITDCQNEGSIQGRKEVGGIVGQMEPITFIEFSEDSLQTLQGQLKELSGLVGQASGNAQNNASKVSGQIGMLQEQAQAAQGAVDTLLPDQENPDIPDPDSTLAAFNTLSSSLNGMPNTIGSITAATKDTVNSLSRDLNAISQQMNEMEKTISSASENLGNSIVDISDQDTDESLTGKVENCINYGAVVADLNAGGIAGAMAIENDLDIMEDWSQYGDVSLNSLSQVRAVILHCENSGTLTCKKQNAGGIVGWQSLGLVKGNTNTGKLDCQNADYVGGITGISTGYIRENFAKCEVLARSYVGGVAGSATIVTDCLTQVKMVGYREKVGGILGTAKESQEENPISGNHYLVIGQDLGAIDGISYLGLAESIPLDAFLQAENTPEVFKTVIVRFIFPNNEVKDISLIPGSSLDPSQVPTLPEQDGNFGVWAELDSAVLDSILFDLSFTAAYSPNPSVIMSEETRDNGLPIVLLEGTFANGTMVHVEPSDLAPTLTEEEVLLEAWSLSRIEGVMQARFLLPESADPATVKMMVCNDAGNWREVSSHQNGSYFIFSLTSNDQCLALVAVPSDISVWVIGAAVLIVLLPIPIVIIAKKKKAKKTTEETNT